MLDVRMNATAFDWFRQAALLILTPKCFDNYFIEFNFFDGTSSVVLSGFN